MKNLAFLNAMKPEEAQKYMGEWIAVADGEIVAHGRDPGQVCDAAWEAGKGLPTCGTFTQSPKRCRGSASPRSTSQSNDLPCAP